MSQYYHGTVQDPLRDVIAAIVGVAPPEDLLPRGLFDTKSLTEDEVPRLRDFLEIRLNSGHSTVGIRTILDLICGRSSAGGVDTIGNLERN